jgi:hypothetical protein
LPDEAQHRYGGTIGEALSANTLLWWRLKGIVGKKDEGVTTFG